MGVGADHGGDPAVEVPAHTDLFTRGLRVHIDQHVVYVVAERVQGGIGFRERVSPRVHEQIA